MKTYMVDVSYRGESFVRLPTPFKGTTLHVALRRVGLAIEEDTKYRPLRLGNETTIRLRRIA